MVATKAALSIRVDALAEPDEKSEVDAQSIGVAHRAKLESRLRALEYQGDSAGVRRFADSGRKQQDKFQPSGETKTYNTAADLVSTQREDPMEVAVKVVLEVKEEKRKAKEERRAKRRAEKEKQPAGDDDAEGADDSMDVDGEEKKEKKEKKRKRRESEGVNGDAQEETQDKVSFDNLLSFATL